MDACHHMLPKVLHKLVKSLYFLRIVTFNVFRISSKFKMTIFLTPVNLYLSYYFSEAQKEAWEWLESERNPPEKDRFKKISNIQSYQVKRTGKF